MLAAKLCSKLWPVTFCNNEEAGSHSRMELFVKTPCRVGSASIYILNIEEGDRQ